MPLTPTFTPNFAPGNEYFNVLGNFTAPDNSGYGVYASTSSTASNTFHTFNGSDYLKGFDGDDALYAGGGNDIVEGGQDDDIVSGDAGDDFLYGDYQYETTFANGDDFIFGGSGDDYLFGAGGNDELNGGTDDDILEGGTGEDVLIGGAGTDTFRFDVGAEVGFGHIDTIRDFEDGTEKIALANTGGLTSLEKFALSGGAETLIVINGTHGIYLEGVAYADIDGSDFDFV